MLHRQNYDGVKELKRKYQGMIVRNLCPQILEVIRVLDLHKLQIWSTFENQIIKLSDLVKALSTLKNLKIFDAWEENFNDDMKEFEKVCPNLESLFCNSNIVHIFNCTTLKVLHLKWNHDMTSERKSLAYKFLGQQKDLEEFRLYELFEDDFFSEFVTFNFRLKSFRYDTSVVMEQHKNLIRFLLSQSDSIKSLEIGIQPGDRKYINEELLNFILNNMSNLISLKLELTTRDHAEEPELQPETDEEMKLGITNVTKSIRHLEFMGKHRTFNECKQFVDLFPNLTHLFYSSDYDEDIHPLKHVSKSNANIDSIDLPLNFNKTSSYFPNLKKLSTWGFDLNKKAFRSFINRHSKTLETIIIRSDIGITKQIADEIMNCENLKFLSMKFCYFKLVKVMNYLFGDDSFKNKPLTFRFDYDFSSQTFNFPEDAIFWNEDGKIFNCIADQAHHIITMKMSKRN